MSETVPVRAPSGQSVLSIFVVSVGLSCLAFYLGLVFLCLIPLQWMYYKAGPRPSLIGAVIVAVLMAGGQLIACWIEFGNIKVLVAINAAIAFAMAGGYVGIQASPKPLAAWLRVIRSYGIILLSLGLTWLLLGLQLGGMDHLAKELSGEIKAIGFKFEDGQVIDLLVEVLLIGLPLGLLVMVLINWYAATWFWRRRLIQWSANSALANFRVAEYMVWPLLFSLAGIGLGFVMVLPSWLGMAVRWVGLGVGFIYFLQGLGILAHAFERRRNPYGRSLSLPLVCAILFVIPGVNGIALLAITLLGVLELWVRMRPATHA